MSRLRLPRIKTSLLPRIRYSSTTAPTPPADTEINLIIEREKQRQRESIVLIPSENFTSSLVLETLGSVMSNKYSEGYPGERYYGGNEFIDECEILCQQRALEAFGLNPSNWGVNVQPLSGSPANLYVYSALLKPHERLMGLDLPHGGHLSHGFQTAKKKISAISSYFETLPYKIDPSTGLVDYIDLLKIATLYRPKLVVAGGSAYPRNWDYLQMRKICDSIGCILMADMAHISGMVAAKVLPSPFEYCDIVTTTTHKSLRGPRGAMIFYRRGLKSDGSDYNYQQLIDFSVFPGHQGGPHNHTIAALAVALKETMSSDFKSYQQQVLKNAKVMEHLFIEKGFQLVTSGTDTHLLVIDLRATGIDGARLERVLELVNIAANKNTIPSDKSALIPYGLRIGTPAMTTRSAREEDFKQIVEFIVEAIGICKAFNSKVKSKKFKDFKELLGDGLLVEGIVDLKKRVIEFSKSFPVVGFNVESMRFK